MAEPSLDKPKSQNFIRKLFWDELHKHKREGTCFHCGEKYVAGHICKEKTEVKLFLMAGEEGEEIEIQNKEDYIPKISLHALTGCDTVRTMRMHALIGRHKLSVLIDSRSTHNFISIKLANKMTLPVQPIGPFHVKVANGEPLPCNSCYVNVPVNLQGT